MSHAHKSFTARVSPSAYRPDAPQADGDFADAAFNAARSTYQNALKHKATGSHAHSSYHRSYTHFLAALMPLVVSEFVHDAPELRRWMRIGGLGVAVAGEVESRWQDRVRERELQEAKAR